MPLSNSTHSIYWRGLLRKCPVRGRWDDEERRTVEKGTGRERANKRRCEERRERQLARRDALLLHIVRGAAGAIDAAVATEHDCLARIAVRFCAASALRRDAASFYHHLQLKVY